MDPEPRAMLESILNFKMKSDLIFLQILITCGRISDFD